MEPENINSDILIKELGGCGSFQIIFSTLAYLCYIPWAFSSLFMSFGAYNPGWRCLDNASYTGVNWTQSTNVSYMGDKQTIEFQKYSCQGFETCQQVEINPEASTIVTEWGLICDKAWVVPLIMMFHMVGSVVGALLLGYLGDRFGRKITLYSHLFLNFVYSLACMFSVCWEMFAVLYFLVGINCNVIGYLPVVYATEFILPKWRIVVGSLPIWPIGAILFSVSALLTRDWKQVLLINALVSLACCIPVFWVPESLRWLAINGKEKKYLKAGKKISGLNKTNLNTQHCITLIQEESWKKSKEKDYGIFDLFRKGYTMFTLILSFTFFSMNIFYFVAYLGLSYLPGNIYINLIIATATELPANIIVATTTNIFGRKGSTITGLLFTALCLFSVVAVDFQATGNAKDISTVVLVVIAKVAALIAWYIMVVYTVELYPTVVRSTASGYGSLTGMVGATIAPYVMPTKPDQFYISYLVMGLLILISSCLIPFLPETKGKPLSDTWGRCTKPSPIVIETDTVESDCNRTDMTTVT